LAEAQDVEAFQDMLEACDVRLKPASPPSGQPSNEPSLVGDIARLFDWRDLATRASGSSDKPKAGGLSQLVRQASLMQQQQLQQQQQQRQQRRAGRKHEAALLQDRRKSLVEQHFAQSRHRLVQIEASHHRDHEHYTELAFEATAKGTYSEREVKSAGKFDERHLERAAYAERHLARLNHDPSSLRIQDGMRAGTNLVRWNRFSVPESYNPFVPPPRYHEKYSKKKPPKLWSLDGSIWEPRKAHSNSHDYFETASALNRMVKNDWIVARSHHHLDQYIVKTCRAIRGNPEHLHDGETANQLFNAPEVRAIEEVLYRHARVVYGAFEYYSVTSHMSETGIGLLDTGGRKIGSLAASADQLDVHGITSHGFFQFCTDCAIEEDGCTHSELSGIWRMVNSQDSGTILRAAEAEYHNLVTFLTRHEWLQCLVRIAVHLHCRADPRTGVAGGNVAEALDKMCYSRLAGKLPPEAMQSSDAFRKASCYTEGTDLVLKRHATTLRSLFDHFSAMGTTSYDDEQNLRDQRLMSCGEWLNLLQATGLIEMRLVPSLRAASMAFQWSRIRSLDQYSNRAEIRLRSMQFEDYCAPPATGLNLEHEYTLPPLCPPF
jgi:hypothetical protein